MTANGIGLCSSISVPPLTSFPSAEEEAEGVCWLEGKKRAKETEPSKSTGAKHTEFQRLEQPAQL